MKKRDHLHWIIPLCVFHILLTPAFIDHWWVSVGRNYRKPANQSCGMGHGYALEFKDMKGRAPSEEEFKSWAIARFSEDVRKLKLNPENGEVDWSSPLRR